MSSVLEQANEYAVMLALIFIAAGHRLVVAAGAVRKRR
jgi:hypothetical protein